MIIIIDHRKVLAILLYSVAIKNQSTKNGVPKCVKVVRKYTEKKKVIYSNISYELNNEKCKGLFPSALFISYGFELQKFI